MSIHLQAYLGHIVNGCENTIRAMLQWCRTCYKGIIVESLPNKPSVSYDQILAKAIDDETKLDYMTLIHVMSVFKRSPPWNITPRVLDNAGVIKSAYSSIDIAISRIRSAYHAIDHVNTEFKMKGTVNEHQVFQWLSGSTVSYSQAAIQDHLTEYIECVMHLCKKLCIVPNQPNELAVGNRVLITREVIHAMSVIRQLIKIH
jgi:hypothetical protein